ncbi:trimeric intracellular cation channel family protein [Reichenbachiella carrageenanivorans]|uniref:Trimeric intracellular cation channel family protein n=1 Tax=Reichenbachiella carrageenanivorans TaxID=2979869 RepID=A0ABY6D447_9BACT|nr:trimeric intracellular cation channel family protein [Reichenbachiella carrageenanivorans]UXX80927.1 trimeric intracellular cation channel family protein [Reichenbachiella carrageenanivorans]
MDLIYTLNIIGTFVFAISGALTASEKKMDAFGSAVIAFITALGGGTLRDLLIGSQPVGWMLDPNYLYTVMAALTFCYLFKKWIVKLTRTMFLFDTIGIGLFAVLGVQKTLSFGLSPAIAIMMGAVSAVFGGVLRDVLSNRVPLIFRREIYATACLAGGGLYYALTFTQLSDSLTIWIAVVVVMAIRVLAVKKGWGLPGIK